MGDGPHPRRRIRAGTRVGISPSTKESLLSGIFGLVGVEDPMGLAQGERAKAPPIPRVAEWFGDAGSNDLQWSMLIDETSYGLRAVNEL